MGNYKPAIIKFAYGNKGVRILWYCQHCNQETEITELVDKLCTYGMNDCPSELYQAWKILRLGTTEYRYANQDVELEHIH